MFEGLGSWLGRNLAKGAINANANSGKIANIKFQSGHSGTIPPEIAKGMVDYTSRHAPGESFRSPGELASHIEEHPRGYEYRAVSDYLNRLQANG